jgi:hypothetical protein
MATTTNFGWETPDDTDLVKDGALAIRTLGSAIDTSLVDLKGGTTGQVLSKTSNTDMDFTWVTSDDANAIQNAIVDAKGDLITATAADTPARLAVGTDGHVLTADSTTATGLKWAAAAAGGKVLQVIQGTYSTSTTSSSSTYADTGLTATITPSSTASKVLVLYTIPSEKTSGHAQNSISYRLLRAGTSIQETNDQMYQNTTMQNLFTFHYSYLDSPSTTSSTIYKVQFRNFANNAAVAICSNNNMAAIILMEIGA